MCNCSVKSQTGNFFNTVCTRNDGKKFFTTIQANNAHEALVIARTNCINSIKDKVNISTPNEFIDFEIAEKTDEIFEIDLTNRSIAYVESSSNGSDSFSPIIDIRGGTIRISHQVETDMSGGVFIKGTVLSINGQRIIFKNEGSYNIVPGIYQHIMAATILTSSDNPRVKKAISIVHYD